jgi:hypothetical protein
MRWMVYLLLAANLGLLTWNLQTHGAVGPANPTPVPDPEETGTGLQLSLLSEIGTETLRPRAAAGEAQVADERRQGESAIDIYNVVGPAPAETPDRHGPAPGTCLTVGPLAGDAPVDAIRDWLEGRGADAEVLTDERREVALYWIYFPPRASREAAIEEVMSLRGKGVSDVIVVPKGDMANAISLGVYSRPETRERRLSELKERGYQPKVAPRYRSKLATWIDVVVADASLVRDGFAERWPNLRLADHPCAGEKIAAGGPDFYNSANDSPPPSPSASQGSGPTASSRAGPDR